MAYEWVPPVVTGVVGVVGVLGTYLTAHMARNAAAQQLREQRTATLEDRTRAEKREAFVGYLESINAARRALEEIQVLTDAEHQTKRFKLRETALTDLALRREHLRLAGSPDVREYARQVFGDFIHILNAASSGEPWEVDNDLVYALLASMRKDLGYELLPEELAALARHPVADPAGTNQTDESS